jgi:hypothetical protein
VTAPTYPERVLLLLPNGRDAGLAASLLSEASLDSRACPSLPELEAEIASGAGLALMAEEALRGADLAGLSHWIETQPSWSDFPFLVLTRHGGGLERNPAAARLSAALGNVSFLERPFHPTTLLSLVKTAVRGRRRQYEARSRIEELHEREESLRLAQEAGGIGTFVVDPAARTVSMSDTFRRIWGIEESVAPLRTLVRTVHPEDRTKVFSRVKGLRSGGLDYVEYRITRPDTGELRWLARRGEVALDSEDQAQRGFGVVYDITERKRAEAAQRIGHERFLDAIDASGSLAGELMRTTDWGETALGPVEAWPSTLRSSLGICLNSRFPVCIYWGSDLTLLYNDPWSAIPGDKHPWALGKPAREAWSDIWPIIGPMFEGVMASGQAVHMEDGLLPMHRRGYTEECYFNYNVSPIYGEDGQVAGLFNAVIETTYRVIGERRARALRELLDRTTRARSPSEACAAAAEVLGSYSADIPFLSLYLLDTSGTDARAVLAASSGLPEGATGPASIPLCGTAAIWPLAAALETGEGVQVEDLAARLGRELVLPPWPEPVRSARVAPLLDPSHPGDILGFLVAGLSPRRAFDPDYQAFIETAAGHVATAIANARSYQEGDRFREMLQAEVEARTRERDRVWTLLPDLLMSGSLDGRLLSANPAWTTVLGYDHAALLGRPFWDLIDPDFLPVSADAIARMREGRTVRHQNRVRTAAGDYRWFDWVSAAAGDIFYAVARDITEEKERETELESAQEQLRQAQKMEAVGQLTGGIAHDFNNLLTGIVGSLDLMQTRMAQGRMEGLERYAKAATASANRAAALTHRLLAFARRQPLDPKPVSANALVTSMEDLLRRTMGETIAIEIVTAEGLWPTLCDPNQLESAILNLAINARDAMPDGGTLTIETSNTHLDRAYASQHPGLEPGPFICIRVTDTGTGMAPDVVARAFDPFFTTKPIGQGTGLGLSMIYGFTRQSGGHAQIASEVGQGTVINLFLPRHRGKAAREAAPPQPADQPRAQAGETVLVVEDEAVVRDLVIEVLQDLGYQALEAADGPSGLAALRTPGRIDLLVTDLGLPGLNGRQMVEEARLVRPELKVLFITGYAENAALNGGFLDAGMEMITKPFAVDALARRIEGMIRA